MSLKYSIVAGALAVSQAFAQAPTTGASQAPWVTHSIRTTATNILTSPSEGGGNESIIPLSESTLQGYLGFYKLQEYYIRNLFKGSSESRDSMLKVLDTILKTATNLENTTLTRVHEWAKSVYANLAEEAGIKTHWTKLLREIQATPEWKDFLEKLYPKSTTK